MSVRNAEAVSKNAAPKGRTASSVRGSVLGPYAEAAQAVGLDSRHMVEEAGLPLTALEQPDMAIPANAVLSLLKDSSRKSAREDFGLLVADAFKLSTLGPLGLLMREQPTVGEALAAFARYGPQLINTLSLEIEPAEGHMLVRPAAFGLMAAPEPLALDLAMGELVRILQALLGADWRPQRACFARPAPSDPEPYRRRFGAVVFDAGFTGLFVTRADLARSQPNADPGMARELARFIEANGVRVDAPLSEQVRALIAEMLPHGECSVEAVAHRLGVDRRTIHRRLAMEGLSFTSLVEARRRVLVAGQMERGNAPLSTLADLLGFSSLSTFSRWYRHAYGDTARRGREAASQGGKIKDAGED